MNNRVRLLKIMFWLPLVVTLVRVIATVVILVWNPFRMPMRLLQVVPMCVLLVYAFAYYKLYNDNDPVILLIVPTILHFLFAWVLKKKLFIVPFILPFALDIIYLVVKGVKGGMFPFEFEGDENVDALDAFDDKEIEDTRELVV